jgi:hypothetical protein
LIVALAFFRRVFIVTQVVCLFFLSSPPVSSIPQNKEDFQSPPALISRCFVSKRSWPQQTKTALLKRPVVLTLFRTCGIATSLLGLSPATDPVRSNEPN